MIYFVKRLLFGFSLLLFFTHGYSQKYKVKLPNKGLFKIKMPFDRTQSVYVTNSNGYYISKVNSIDGSINIFGEKDEVFQISEYENCESKLLSNHLEFDSVSTRQKLRYSVSPFTDNWFYEIVKPNKVYSKSLRCGHFYDYSLISVKLYNFDKIEQRIEVRLNKKVHEIFIAGESEFVLNKYVKDNNGIIDITVKASKVPLGIKNIKWKLANKILKLENEVEFFDIPFKKLSTSHLYNEYVVCSLSNNVLEEISFSEIKENMKLIISKKDNIKWLSLSESIQINSIPVDYLVIYHSNFINHIPDIVSEIETDLHGLKIVPIDVQHIFDTYNYSERSSSAIKTFIHSCSPKYVLFVGDACYQKYHVNNKIPSYNYSSTNNTLILSDYYYTYDKNPLLPLISIARLPFNNSDELGEYLRKSSHNKEILNSNVLVFDNLNVIDRNLKIEKVRKCTTQEFFAKVNNSNTNLILYIGHGNEIAWENNHLINFKNVQKIAKKGFTLFDLSCWTGTFGLRKTDSLSEKLLKLKNGPTQIVSFAGYSEIESYSAIAEYVINSNESEIGSMVNGMKSHLLKSSQLSIDDTFTMNIFGFPHKNFR